MITKEKKTKSKELSDLVVSIASHIGQDALKSVRGFNQVLYKIASFEDLRYLRPNRAIYSNDVRVYNIPAYAYANVDNRVNYAQNRVIGRIYQNR